MRSALSLRALALAFLLFASSAHALPVADYIGALEHIESLLASKQLAAAKSEARMLQGANVTWTKGTFRADESLLLAIVEAKKPDGAHRARLLTTIAEIRRVTGMESASADRKLLERIAAEQEPPALPKGGAIPTAIEKDVPLLERIAQSISDMWDWVARQVGKFLDWLLDLLPRPRILGPAGASGLTRWVTFGVVALIVVLVLVLAFNVLRRSRPAAGEPVETSSPLGSRSDEDPLSRGATEWERYAAQLAAAGKFREAIRAWYHAVLVTCYAAGILHFRKGRTNWEYVASLGPSLAWRPDMIELTRRFEREWYGSLHSTPEALDACSERAQQILHSLRRAA